MLKTFEDLEIWKRGCSLAVDVLDLMDDSKDFALKDQMSRSSLSIPSNIAEGSERDSTADFIRFLRYSKSSASELRTQLYIHSKRLTKKEISTDSTKKLIQETKEIASMIQGFINHLRKQD